jgi:hypothetical protein
MDLRTAWVRAARVFVLIGVVLVALGVPTAAQADTRSCPPNFSGFPGASKIRVTNAYCATAMRIVRNIRRNITRGLPERIGRFGAPTDTSRSATQPGSEPAASTGER